MEIGKISTIQTGLMLARKRTSLGQEGSTKYNLLSLKSISTSGEISPSESEIFFSKGPVEEKYLTKRGDVIQRLTVPFTATSIKNEEGLLVSSNFVIIRLEDSNFLPEYVAIFLNSEYIKKKLSKLSISKTIPLVKISHLRNISIKEIPQDMQKKIIDFNKLRNMEKNIIEQLFIEKKKSANIVLNKLLINN
jgi:restriction endonuclease S subunit